MKSPRDPLGSFVKAAKARAARKVRVRKKPCPYCGKLLVATTKGKWRRNLAQHHEHCEPGQAHWRELAARELSFIVKTIETLMAVAGIRPVSFEVAGQCAEAARDVSELERLYQLEKPK